MLYDQISNPMESLFSSVQGSYDMTAEVERDDLKAEKPVGIAV